MFKPWIGEKYGARDNFVGGKRVLIVGESHHATEHKKGAKVPEMTNDTMHLYASRPRNAGWLRTLDNVAWAVAGRSREQLERGGKRGEFEVWNSLAFYNYITVVLAEGSRSERPSSQQFADSRDAFEHVLASTNPDVLLICGFTLFPWVIRNHYPEYAGNPWEFKGEWIDLPRRVPIRAVRLLHPSAAFSAKAWHDVIRRALTN